MRLGQDINRVIPTLCNCLDFHQIPRFFELILDLVKTYEQHLGEMILPLLRSILVRIVKEMRISTLNKHKTNHVIEKAWTIVLEILSSQRSFLQYYYAGIEREMTKIYNTIIYSEFTVDFDDKMIDSWCKLIRGSKQISINLWNFFPYLKQVFDKNKKFMNEKVLEAIITFINYRNDVRFVNSDPIMLIFEMAVESLILMNDDFSLNKIKGCLILQSLFFSNSQN